MEFDSAHIQQFGVALALVVIFLIAAFTLSEKSVMWIILLFIPFQPISSRYGSINEFLVLVIAGIYLLRGRLKRLPLGTAIGFIMFAYVLSMTQAPPGTLPEQLLYLLAIASNFALLWLVYKFIRRSGDWQTILKILGVLNALVLAYCAVQASFGMERFAFLGSAELAFDAVDFTTKLTQQRVTGPFGSTAMIAEYFSIQIVIWGYFLIHAKDRRPRILATVLIALNCGFLIATGNRGGIVTIAVGGLGYLFLFGKELGLRRTITVSLSAVLIFVVTSVTVINYTQFDILFERLAETEFEGGFVPDSRQGWFGIWDQVIEKPIIGHGPRMGIDGVTEMPFPHNLFMFLFYTLGMVGLAAYTYFFWKIWTQLSRARRYKTKDKFLSGTSSLGLIILVMFLASEMRMELMRWTLHDYQQYFFMILGVFLAFSDMVRYGARQSHASRQKSKRRKQPVIGTAVPSRS
jgi:hypothetical protein